MVAGVQQQRQVDTVSNAVLPSPSCKQGSSSRPRTSPADARGAGTGRQEVAERQEDSIRRLFGGRPDAQKVGGAGRRFCVKVSTWQVVLHQEYADRAGGKSLTILKGPWYRPRRSGGD